MTLKELNKKNGTVANKVLYVFIHGLISLVDEGDRGFLAYLLRMRVKGKEEHVYKAGEWLIEKDIPRGYRGSLEGVTAGIATLDSSLHAVIQGIPKSSAVTSNKVQAVINLPRPSKIHYLGRGKVESGGITGDLASLKQVPKSLSGLRVFEYSFTDGRNVFLGKSSRRLWQCSDPGAAIYTALHIYDQPPADMSGTTHNQREFTQSAAFFGKKLTLAKKTTGVAQPKLLPGMIPGEASCLFLRPGAWIEIETSLRAQLDLGSGTGGCGSELCAGCDGAA